MEVSVQMFFMKSLKMYVWGGNHGENGSHIQCFVKFWYSDWGVISWASWSMLWNLASSNKHYRHASQGRALLKFLCLTMKKGGCAPLLLPRVMTKTSATVLFAMVSLLQLLFRCVCVCARAYTCRCVFARADIFLCDPSHTCPGWRVKREGQESPPGRLLG